MSRSLPGVISVVLALRLASTHPPQSLLRFWSLHTGMDDPSEPKPSRVPPNSPSHSDVDFPGGELTHALQEHSFGVSQFEITSVSAHEASARIILLEQSSVTVVLTTSGYAVRMLYIDGYERGPLMRIVQINQGAGLKTFETLEDLLASISPAYVERRQQSLLAKLQVLAQNQENA